MSIDFDAFFQSRINAAWDTFYSDAKSELDKVHPLLLEKKKMMTINECLRSDAYHLSSFRMAS